MRLLEWVQVQPLHAAGFLGLLVGLAFGLAWPVNVPAPEKQRAETWAALPGLEDARPREREYSAARDAPIWGGIASANAAVKRATWLLAGIIADPLPAALVLPEGSKDAKRVRVGEPLPDGGMVKQILTSGVTYTLEGCTYERLLYGPVEPVDNDACNPGAR